MKKILAGVIVFAVCFCLNLPLVYSQAKPPSGKLATRTVDVDKDGDPDVTYYHDGKYISKAEADTNDDGRPDITVYAEDGKFKSAEADTNNDGKPDKKFNNSAEFSKWLNKDNPEYKDSLGWSDWTYSPYKF